MSMYAKLMARITESSLMEESIIVRYTFMMLLAVADPKGYAIGTDVALARRLNMPLDEFRKAVAELLKPDADSNSKEYDGRRIIESDGERGYFLVNYAKYRDTRNEEERREWMREYMQKYRGEKKAAETNGVNSGKPRKLSLANGDAPEPEDEEVDAEREEEPEARKVVRVRTVAREAYPPPLDTDAFKAKWKEYVSFRSRSKFKPLLPESTAAQFKKLAEFGEAIAVLAIEASIANGWQGLFPEKIKPPAAIPGAPVAPRAPVDPPGWRDFLAEHGKPYTSFPMTPGWLREEFTERKRQQS